MALTILTIVVVAGAAGAALGDCWAKRRVSGDAIESLRRAAAAHPVWIASVVVACAGLLAPTLSDDLCQRLPYVWQRHHSAVAWGGVCGVVAFGFAFIAAAARRGMPRDSHFLVATMAVGIALVAMQSGLRQKPVAAALRPRVSPEGIILQSHPASCGAASLANLAGLHGLPLTEDAAARLLGTTAAGTSRGQMRFAFSELGMACDERRDPSATLAELPAPALLIVDHPAVGREGHMVLYRARVEGGYEIWDPLKGRVEWTESEARSRWHGRAFCGPLPGR